TCTAPLRAGMRPFSEEQRTCQENLGVFSGYIWKAKSRLTADRRATYVRKWSGTSGYGMPPSSLPSIEPAQLLALEVARAALTDAGYAERPFPRERTGVVLGMGGGA